MATASSNRGHRELDLDSFLRSHGTGSSDDDGGDEETEANGFHHRTVDEILNESDSSSSSGDGSSPWINSGARPSVDGAGAENLDEPSGEGDNEEEPHRTAIGVDLGEFGTVSALTDSNELSTSSVSSRGTRGAFSLSSSRSLPPLFGGLWSNPRPGAALAAAVAASRSIPTPHAAAIKSRRASVSSLEKIGQSLGLTDDPGFEESAILDIPLGEYPSSRNNLGGEPSVEPHSADRIFGSSLPSPSSSSSSASPDAKGINAAEEKLETALDLTDSGSASSTSVIGNEIVHEEAVNPPESLAAAEEEQFGGNLPFHDNTSDKSNIISQDGNMSDFAEETKILFDANDVSSEKAGQLGSNKRAARKAEKKLRSSMKPLEWAEELEKRQASSGLHWEEGAVAQPMRLKGIRREPPAVGYLQTDTENAVTRALSSQTFVRDHGSPQVLAVHVNYIAVGTSKGLVLMIPSKYSSQCADNMDAKMLVLGSHGDKPHVPVTSMCFNPQGDLLLVGYADGHLTVWDVQKASYMKIITGEHSAPVVHALFLGQDLQVTRQFKVVTGDSKGLVLLHAFSVVPLLNRFSIKTQCLLDGQKTGTVLSACPLLINELYFGPSSAQGNHGWGVVGGEAGWKLFNEGMLAEEGVVIFVTHQNALVVRLSPNLEVYEKLSRPDGAREGSMPYTAWKSSTYSRATPGEQLSANAPDRVSWLAIAWDLKVEIFKLIKSKLTKHSSWNLDNEVVGVEWLDDQMLVILTLRGYLGLYRNDGHELHRTSFVVDATGRDDIIAYHTYFTNSFGNPEKAYHNSVAVRGATVYILSRMHLSVSRLLPWKERIQTLQKAGDWMGALDLAMRLYDGQAHGVIDLPKSVDAIRETIMPFLVEMILSYVDEVFSYISVAFGYQIVKLNQEEDRNLRNSSATAEEEEQFACVGGVAVEFCVHIRRIDILFDDIFSKFVAVQHRGTFLEILEPYILKDMLGCLPPEIMQALVEYYSSKGWLQRVEQCVLHMDISSLDFNQVTKLCREHGLYSALIYLFNRGLDDYRTPLEDLLVVIQNDQRTDATLQYRMLIYLKYCFLGLAFPPGHGTLPPSRLPSVRKELLEFLLEDSTALTSKVIQNFKSSYGACPYLCYLLWLDTESALEVLRCAFIEESLVKSNNSMEKCTEFNVEDNADAPKNAEDKNTLLQNIVNLLIIILNVGSNETRSFQVDENGIIESWPLKKDVDHVIEFIAHFIASKRVTVSGNVLKYILEYLTSDLPSSQREKQVLSLLKVVPQMDWDSSSVLDQCLKAQFFQACGLIYAIRGNYLSALDSYMKDFNEPFIAFVFIHDMMSKLKNSEFSTFRLGVKSRIPELVKLSREDAFLLVLDHFDKESLKILSELQGYPESLFLFLKTIIDAHLRGTLNFPVSRDSQSSDASLKRTKESCSELRAYLDRVSDFARLLQHNPFSVDDKTAELYVELMCQYEPSSVLRFLETFDNYRLEHCLRLCQEYDVNDAAAFLLERAGDVGGALEFLMSGLDGKVAILATAVEALCVTNSGNLKHTELLNTCLNMDEVSSVRNILHMAIGLCQRNTQRLDPRESESLWFRVLDLYCEPLRDLYDDREISQAGPSLISSDPTGARRRSSFRHRFSKLSGVVSILRVIFSHFIKEVVEKMVGYVPLSSVMSKILADNGAQEFGDFKLTLLELLGTYGYERRILGTAKSLIEDDTFYTLNLLRKGASHAYAPQSLVCCLCGCSLAKVSSSSSIRVFNCGHATHLHCEPQENGAVNRDSPAGCPICMPKRKPVHPRGKSVLTENRLIKNPRSRTTKGVSSVYHLHEPDTSEKPHGTPLSRFEILSNLQESRRLLQADPIPPLRLAPPSIYHEKVQKGANFLQGDTSGSLKNDELNRSSQPRDAKPKGFSKKFPLKSTIFGQRAKRLQTPSGKEIRRDR
ncbi:unnamed protein product [Spirodela intermedia]|uniref:RING-type domain-containing protein n=1 Tax=Spirodela intermedia TaxID=51605 RepID=A0A7I8IDK9_SPIIN|nr:unnamed protein product [Spirodela intermedia]CAA6655878.1 unnamed protein product [Spirodela intermedia]